MQIYRLGLIAFVIAFSVTELTGCATPPSYAQQLASRLMPVTQQDKINECKWIRSEIARQQSLAMYGAATATSPMINLAYQSTARQHISLLESRAAGFQCQAAFSTVVASPAPTNKLDFDQCFAHCQQLTSRTKEQCFDSCK